MEESNALIYGANCHVYHLNQLGDDKPNRTKTIRANTAIPRAMLRTMLPNLPIV